MADYLNVSWEQFSAVNDEQRITFEDMCRRLFNRKYAPGIVLHSNPNNVGVEVEPVQICFNGKKLYISFQTKYYGGKVNYQDIEESIVKAANAYRGGLDLIYIYCNKPINRNSLDKRLQNLLKTGGVEYSLITDNAILDLVKEHQDIAAYYFTNRERGVAAVSETEANEQFHSTFHSGEKFDRDKQVEKAFRNLWNLANQKLNEVEGDKFRSQDKDIVGLQTALLAPIYSEDHMGSYPNLCEAINDIMISFDPCAPIVLTAHGGQGKSTHLIYLWRYLQQHQDTAGDNKCVCLRFEIARLNEIISERIQKNRNTFMPILLKTSGLGAEDTKVIIDEMRKIPSESQFRFFFIFDGLDEVNEDATILKELGKLISIENCLMNIQVIFAGRNIPQAILTRNLINFKVGDLKWKDEQVQQWLVNSGIKGITADESIYDEIGRNPMMLMMLCRIKLDGNHQRIKSRLFNYNEHDHVSRIEVLWNYTEVLLEKYMTNGQLNKEDRLYAKRFISERLPLAAYSIYFDKDRLHAAEHSLREIWNDVGEFDRCCELLKGPFSGIIDSYGQFSHRLWRDYFAMLYIGNLMKKLFQKCEISDLEYQSITDIRFWDNKEYTDILVSIVPGVLGFTTGRYELKMEEELDMAVQECSKNPAVYGIKRHQCLCILRAFYPRWTTEYYLFHHPACKTMDIQENQPDQNVIRMFIKKSIRRSFDYMEELAKDLMDEEKRCLPAHNASLVFCLLSQYYRTCSLLMKAKQKSRIDDLVMDLNKSLEFALHAKRMYTLDSTLIDCFNCIAKAFNSAYEELDNRIRRGEQSYELCANDLVLDEGMLLDAELSLPKTDLEELISAKPADVLGLKAMKCRKRILKKMADYWLDVAINSHCTPSMNLRALILEIEQEEKPVAERSFLCSFKEYYDASKTNHPVSDYSAFKAGQLLSERKVGLDEHGEPCNVEDACAENTVKEAMALFEKAVSFGQNWERVAYCRGMLKLNYHYYDFPLTEDNALLEAFHDFEIAFDGWKAMPVILALVETGLQLYRFQPALVDKKKSTLSCALDTFWGGFPGYKCDGDRHADTWTPSIYVFRETCERVYEISRNGENTLVALGLSQQMMKCVQLVRKREREIKGCENKRRNEKRISIGMNMPMIDLAHQPR